MAKGKRNNKRGRGGHNSGHNSTNDSDANMSTLAQDGSIDHKGFSTGAFGTSDIDGSGLQREVIIESNETELQHDSSARFGAPVTIPSRSRTSSVGNGEAHDHFLNPNDLPALTNGQHSQSSVRSRTSLSAFERAHRMSQLSIQTNQDEFVLVPGGGLFGSGGGGGGAGGSIRSYRSQTSRQSAAVGMSSRDDMLTEGDEEMGGGERREEEQNGYGGAAAVEIPITIEVGGAAGAAGGGGSRRASEWELQQLQQQQADTRSRTSLYSHKSGAGGWQAQQSEEAAAAAAAGAYVVVPSHHASRVSVYSAGGDAADDDDEPALAGNIGAPVDIGRYGSKVSVYSTRDAPPVGGGYEVVDQHQAGAPVHLSRHASRASVYSHRSAATDGGFGGGGAEGFVNVESHVGTGGGGGSRAPSHHASRMSVRSHVSTTAPAAAAAGCGGYVHVPASHHGSRMSVGYDLQQQHHDDDDWDNNEQVFGGRGASHASRHSLAPSNRAPSHHASKASIYSHAGGDAGVVPFQSRPPASVHASRHSIHSRLADDQHWMGDEEQEQEGGGAMMMTRGSRTSTRSQMSCIACDDDDEEDERHHHLEEEARLGLPQLGDEIVVPPEAVDEWGEQVDVPYAEEEQEQEEMMMREAEAADWGMPQQQPGEIYVPRGEEELQHLQQQQRSVYGSRASLASSHHHPGAGGGAALGGGRSRSASQHASRMSMHSHHGDAGFGSEAQLQQHQQQQAAAPVPAVRLSRLSLNQQRSTTDLDYLNHNSQQQLQLGSLVEVSTGAERSSHDLQQLQQQQRSAAVQPHLRTSLRSLNALDLPPLDPVVHTGRGGRERRFSSRSTQDAAAWGETVQMDEDEDDRVFEEGAGAGGGGGVGWGERAEAAGRMGSRRSSSRRSLYSTRSSKAGEQTEENLLQAMINRSREPSVASLADRPYIPPKDGWQSSTHSVNSTAAAAADYGRRSRGHSRSASVHLVGADINLRDEVVIPLSKSRSRTLSVASGSRRSLLGGDAAGAAAAAAGSVNFADQPELYSHPDDRFGMETSREGVPFRRTGEHEKTPQPGAKRSSRVYGRQQHEESEEELRALASSSTTTTASASATSMMMMGGGGGRAGDNTPPPSAGFATPRSRESRESYLGTAEISMPSPSPFNQTQFAREEYEAIKEKRARASSVTPPPATFLPFSPSSERHDDVEDDDHDDEDLRHLQYHHHQEQDGSLLLDRSTHSVEMATQTGETIARAAGQRFVMHYGATLSTMPKQQQSQLRQGGVPPSAASSVYSMPAPPPPSCSPPHDELDQHHHHQQEPRCILQHHQMMEEEERRQWMQQQQLLQPARCYEHGDDGAAAGGMMMEDGAAAGGGGRKSSSSTRFAPLPAYDMSYVKQYEARSSSSSSKMTTAVSNSTSSSTIKSQQQHLQHFQNGSASAASSYVDHHLRPVQPCAGATAGVNLDRDLGRATVSMEMGGGAAAAAARRNNDVGFYAHDAVVGSEEEQQQEQEEHSTFFSPSKGTVAQKAAAFQHKEDVQQQQQSQLQHDYQPVFTPHYQPLQHNLQQMQLQKQQQQQAARAVPITLQQSQQRGAEIVVPVQRAEQEFERNRVTNVEIRRAASAASASSHQQQQLQQRRPLQQAGYVHIERPKMNNSFERNNHPAAAVLNSLLSARANSSANTSRSCDDVTTTTPFLARQPSSVGGTCGGGYIPAQPMHAYLGSAAPHAPPPPPPPPGFPYQQQQQKAAAAALANVMTSPGSGYQRSIRPLRSEDATFHYEMKHDLSVGGGGGGGVMEQRAGAGREEAEISKDEHSVLSRVGAMRADTSPKGGAAAAAAAAARVPLRSAEADRAYATYHDKKSSATTSATSAAGAAISLTSAPKPFTPASPYRSSALGQQQQVYGAFRIQPVQQTTLGAAAKQPYLERLRAAGNVTPPTQLLQQQAAGAANVVAAAPAEPTKYTGSTIRRAIPQRGHIRNLAAAFDTIQNKADREVTVIEPNNASVLQRRASSTAAGAASSGAPHDGSSRPAWSGRAAGSTSSTISAFGGGISTQKIGEQSSAARREEEELLQMSRTGGGYTERNIHEWQAANEQQQLQHREEYWLQQHQQLQHQHQEDELILDSESDRMSSGVARGGGAGGGGIPVNGLRTSTPLAGGRHDPRDLAAALEQIPSIRRSEQEGETVRGRAAARGGAAGGVRSGGVRALASRFEAAAEQEQEKARSASMTPRLRRKQQEPRRLAVGDDQEMEDRREAAARRLSRGGVGGVERLEREREKRRSQSAHVGMRKRRTTTSTSSASSDEESVMRGMLAVERMAREELLRKEREEMRERKGRGGAARKRIVTEEERKIDEMFHGVLESQESAGERETPGATTVPPSSRGGTASGADSVRTTGGGASAAAAAAAASAHHYHHEQQLQHVQHYREVHHQHYQYQQQYREHHQHQHHHYQSHLQPLGQAASIGHLHTIPPQQQQQPAAAAAASAASAGRGYAPHLHQIGTNGALVEGGVSRRESTHTVTTTNTQSSAGGRGGLVYSPSVYRETGRAMRDAHQQHHHHQHQHHSSTLATAGSPLMAMSEMTPMMMMDGGAGGARRERAATIGGGGGAGMERGAGAGGVMNMTTASSPHFSPVNIRGPETAGQRVATYESRDGRNPVRVPSRQVRPYALATSTPMGTVQSGVRGGAGGATMPLMMDEGAVLPPEAVEDDSFLSTISGESGGGMGGAGGGARSSASQAEYKKQISRLQTVQSMEEEKISITSKALAHARKKQSPGNELAAQRTILLGRLRVAALKRELQRLSALAIVRNPPPPVSRAVLGAMDISDIQLQLNKNLCSRAGEGGPISFGFIVVLKCGVEVEATAPVVVVVGQRPTGPKAVHFPEHLRFSNLPVDFTIRLEVYVMAMQKVREPKEESCTAVLATKARNLLVPGTRRAAITAGPGGSQGSGGSPAGASAAGSGELKVGELVRCGHTALDRDSVGPIKLYLDAPEYPLEGTIELASRCSRLPSSVEVDLRGFLTMYKVVGGLGSWQRYWAVLRRGIINFWKYPDDEQLDRGGPVASADLSKCTDGEIQAAPREICTRQFAFSIDMLVATTPSIVEKKRVLLAADTREQLRAWLAALNETLAAIRA